MYVPEIDSQHQEMFRLAGELRQAVLESEKAERLALRARLLADCLAGHLTFEERLMRDAEYPSLEWHERQHRTARSKLAALRSSIEDAQRQSVFEAVESLAAWMRDHTAVADRMAGAYLRNHWRASACTIC